ncbi:hypothetical protein CK203_052286 [Vitis vinifera]|uniref:Uncharacterized protein n=1 Tax=Vitis vinifera TaxID=29760 RepID=A0A438FWJ2_VITVI|nr:hypothetical protein CK203_052286 [Vitis vinifera]
MKSRPSISFETPRPLASSFLKHRTLRIPHFSRPPCDLVPLHSIPIPVHVSHQRDAFRAPSELRPEACLPFSTWRGPEEPLPPLHRDVLRGKEPPRLRYETRRPPTTLGATTSRPESSVPHPPAKRAKTSGPGESSRASEHPTDSELPSDMLEFQVETRAQAMEKRKTE